MVESSGTHQEWALSIIDVGETKAEIVTPSFYEDRERVHRWRDSLAKRGDPEAVIEVVSRSVTITPWVADKD